MVSRVDRCALFVDAGYALADGAMAVHGTRRRDSVSWDHAGLLKLLAGLARDRTGLPVLRCYWYETAGGGRTAEHDALAEMPGLKLRLVSLRPGRREGIESQLRRDIVTLAKSGAIADAFIASADEHLAEMVGEVQDLGLRVVILHIASDGGWTIPQPLRQECDDIVEISGVHLRPFVDLIRGAEPATLNEQYATAGYGSDSGANRNGSHQDARPESGAPFGALPAAVGDYAGRVGSDFGPTRSDSSVGPAQQGPTQPYMDSRSAHEAAARQAATTQVGTTQVGASQAGTAQSGTTQAGTTQAGTAQSGTPQAGTPQAGTAQAGTGYMGTAQAGTGFAGTAQANPVAATAQAGLESAGAGPAGPGSVGTHHGTSGLAGAGQIGTDQGGIEQFSHGPLGNGRIDLDQHGARQARMPDFGAAQADAGGFGVQAGPEQFGARQGRAGEFGARQGRAGEFGAQAGPEQFRGEQSRAGEFGAHVGRDQFGAGQGRADQLASGSGGHGQYGSGQFG